MMAEPSRAKSACPRCAVLERRVAGLEKQLDTFKLRVAELERLLWEATRASKRQAAPFSRNRPKVKPKKPGRKAGTGYGTHARRAAPPEDQITETIDVPLNRCPSCGGRLEDWRRHEQIITDIPEVRPVTRRYLTHSGHCRRCNKRARSRHPEQTSDATGAAANQIGPNALALAADLKHRLGISYRKITDFFETHYRLHTCPGALARSGQRLARLSAGTYRLLVTLLRHSPVVYADETGWRIAARSAWLWVFTNKCVTLYVIRADRSQAVIRQILGLNFEGVLASDCFLAYDPIEVNKQKCLAHLLKDLSVIEALKNRRAVHFSRKAAQILRAATALKRRRKQLSPHGYATACGRIEARMDRLLAGRYTDPDNRRLANRLRKHRDHLFTFLYHEAVEPTNNAAERALRPAVISRKLSAGNRSPTGAETHSILASLCQTARQNSRDFRATARSILQHRDPSYIASILPKTAPA